MKKNILQIILLLLTATIATAQVGIGNTSPQAQLDITAANPANPTNADGILIPRVSTLTSAASMTAGQNGMLVYLTADIAGKPKGFYYWEDASASWIGLSGSKGWDLLGNSGTDPTVNFLGTTDDKDLAFRRFNLPAGKIAQFSTAIGSNAMPINTAGNNTAFGNQVLSANTTGNSNTGVGTTALFSNTTGNSNIAMGYGALNHNVTASNNVAFGNNALFVQSYVNGGSVYDTNNTAVGNGALFNNNPSSLTTGKNNTSLGYNALYGNTSGSNNIGIGANAEAPSPTASDQLSIGNVIYGTAMSATLLGKIGVSEPAPAAKLHISPYNKYNPANTDGLIIPRVTALVDATSMTAAQNGMMVYLESIYMLRQPGFYYWDQPTATWKAVGSTNNWSLQGNQADTSDFLGTTINTDLVFKRNNVESGRISLFNTSFGRQCFNSTSTGDFNTAYGSFTLYKNTTGHDNVAIGKNTMSENLSGSDNTAVGVSALSNSPRGNENVAIGRSAMATSTSASKNTAVGVLALMGQNYANANTVFDTNNTAIGYEALMTNNPTNLNNGKNNTAIGHTALKANTIGADNTAIGYRAMTANLTGYNNLAMGSDAMLANTAGYYNVALGSSSLSANLNGLGNVAIGYWALKSNTSGNGSVAIGLNALQTQSFSNGGATWAANNIAIGGSALNSTNPTTVSNGINNIGIGANALFSNTTGYNNIAVGTQALNFCTGVGNVGVGGTALFRNNGSSYNTAIGHAALYNSFHGSGATAIGYEAMTNANNTATYYLNASVAVGYQALRGSGSPANNTGNNNTALGYQALLVDAAGYDNTATGNLALADNTDGNSNTANGSNALRRNTVGTQNSALGEQAMFKNTGGSYNVAVGTSALHENLNGTDNAALGPYAGYSSLGSQNTFLGSLVYPSGGTYSNYTGIGYFVGTTAAAATNAIEFGNGSVTVIRAQPTGFTAYSDRRIKTNIRSNVPGLEFITKLNPVTYNLDIHKQNEMLYKHKKEKMAEWPEKYDIEKITQTGFIAQEVAEAAESVHYDFNGVSIPKNSDELYGVNYTSFVVPLVKAVQEQQQIIEQQQLENQILRDEVESLRKTVEQRIQAIEAKMGY